MVCLPCIVIPLFLWVFHKWIQPFILKFWNPWGKKSVEKDGTPADLDTSTKEYQFIQEHTKANPVIMFSKTGCSFSKMAKDVLDKVGVNYSIEEIDHLENCEQIQDVFAKLTGGRTVPRVFVGGKCIGGGSETWSLHNQEKLVPMMKEAGATFKKTD